MPMELVLEFMELFQLLQMGYPISPPLGVYLSAGDVTLKKYPIVEYI